ncbi:hypothetical protein FHS85_002890 [Rhodoligotrophos appendicifer]|uniref:hypothetical protein n=1 Tax=Rhodoligotrophos appendicifer TaxID=987056 RepID=UPI001184B867|nr:hypothetical protein [Rhodoligotrophos appendicifer]
MSDECTCDKCRDRRQPVPGLHEHAARPQCSTPTTQRQMNEAFYVDVCRAERRLKEFITASLELLDSLPDHWHRNEENHLRFLCEETSAVLSPHMHPPKFVEIATKGYGGAFPQRDAALVRINDLEQALLSIRAIAHAHNRGRKLSEKPRVEIRAICDGALAVPQPAPEGGE